MSIEQVKAACDTCKVIAESLTVTVLALLSLFSIIFKESIDVFEALKKCLKREKDATKP